MNTPITDNLYWELQGKYGTGTFEDALPLARRLELDRAALMGRLRDAELYLASLYDHTVADETSSPDEERGWVLLCEIRSTLAAARANFPSEDSP